MALLKVDGLTKTYDNQTGLHQLSFALEPGEIVGLVGPNGAGKSTTIKAMLGLIQPDQGQVRVGPDDMVVGDIDAKRIIGYIPEFPVVYSDLTIREHIQFLGMAYGIPQPELQRRYRELLQRFSLFDKENVPVIYLSKGMEQKLAMLCALIHKPSILIADEPFNGLDPHGQRELKDVLKTTAAQGGTILLCTHQLDAAERICDRFIILNHGHHIASGTLDHIRTLAGLPIATLEEAFLRLTQEGAA